MFKWDCFLRPPDQPERGLLPGRETRAVCLVWSKCLAYPKSTKEAVGRTALMAGWAGCLEEQPRADVVNCYSPIAAAEP